MIPNPEKAGQLPLSFRDTLLGEDDIDKQKMNRLMTRLAPVEGIEKNPYLVDLISWSAEELIRAIMSRNEDAVADKYRLYMKSLQEVYAFREK